jgi:hypothetical protein
MCLSQHVFQAVDWFIVTTPVWKVTGVNRPVSPDAEFFFPSSLPPPFSLCFHLQNLHNKPVFKPSIMTKHAEKFTFEQLYVDLPSLRGRYFILNVQKDGVIKLNYANDHGIVTVKQPSMKYTV